jgi:hypothetical protein
MAENGEVPSVRADVKHCGDEDAQDYLDDDHRALSDFGVSGDEG